MTDGIGQTLSSEYVRVGVASACSGGLWFGNRFLRVKLGCFLRPVAVLIRCDFVQFSWIVGVFVFYGSIHAVRYDTRASGGR